MRPLRPLPFSSCAASACSLEQSPHGRAQHLARLAPPATARAPLRVVAWGPRPLHRPPRATRHAREDLPRHDFLGRLLQDLGELAGGRRRNLHGDLVGLELEQGLVLAHGITGGLAPAQYRGLRALLVRGGDDVDLTRAQRPTKPLMVAAMPATLGSTASSSTGLCGLGTSGMARRSMGASRSKNASSREHGRDLRTESGREGILMHDQAAMGLAHRRECRLFVPRRQGAQVEEVGVEPQCARARARSARPSRPR